MDNIWYIQVARSARDKYYKIRNQPNPHASSMIFQIQH